MMDIPFSYKCSDFINWLIESDDTWGEAVDVVCKRTLDKANKKGWAIAKDGELMIQIPEDVPVFFNSVRVVWKRKLVRICCFLCNDQPMYICDEGESIRQFGYYPVDGPVQFPPEVEEELRKATKAGLN